MREPANTMNTINRLLLLTVACFCLALCWSSAHADDTVNGTPFFLLSDASFGAKDTATVRLEAQNMGAVAQYGGVDVYVYKVKQPLEFLRKQKNLHRIDTEGDFVGEGLSNAVARIWDNWWNGSRAAWRNLFSSDARQAVTSQAPETRSSSLASAPTPQTMNPQYRPLKAHTLVDSFRYPVQIAKPIAPPKGVHLEGSSSDFIQSPPGNVLIPLGKKEPGLYLVETMVGDHRASTLVFVSNSIAVTKVSARQMLVWVAQREDGQAIAGAKTMWTDGVGALSSGKSDRFGLVSFEREVPEKSYVYGEDPQGGVFIAENFYYDSEIYNAKMYAITDRPLYRAGEQVFIKFFGRDFHSARESTPIAEADIKLQVFDPNGFPVGSQSLRLTPQAGGNTSFQLPDNAVAGGYEIRFNYKDSVYSAAFRVSEYQKPHFEINVLPSKRDFKTNEEISGRLQLTYPDGKPVTHARAELTVRAQRMTMIEGDLGYAGQFPVQLTNDILTTDDKGYASFTIPGATDPSRYIFSVLATDGAAFRVRATKEILVERGADTYAIKSDREFSAAGEDVNFSLRNVVREARLDTAGTSKGPVTWKWVRLEDRGQDTGKLPAGERFTLRFPTPGTYTLSLHDAAGNIVAASTHYVSGAGVSAPQGSIQMVFDKTSYRPGELAHALITFPQKVDQALLTLERDRVEQSALMSGTTAWATARRVTDNQWQVEMPVQETYGPNITLSVVYVKGGEYVFQNLGLKVEQPKVEVKVRADKPVYAPGDLVTLDLDAVVGGKPVANTTLTVGVVDEMIYVLQPEIAPDMFDFFYHPRRNNVRTSSSLNFIAYDLAKPPTGPAMPSRRQTHERAIKLLERPRRDDKDTAYWAPTVRVDANGHARVSFTMPDSLTRWRVTVRAMSDTGTVGQNTAYVRSDKDYYVKWTSPNWMRSADKVNASVAIFNQGQKDTKAELNATGLGVNRKDTVTLKPGANFVALPLTANLGDGQLNLALTVDGKPVDALNVPIKVESVQWRSLRSVSMAVAGTDTALTLPADASNVRLQFTDSASSEFRRLMDDLIDYPYGCVEQTSSRLIPYSLALKAAGTDEALRSKLSQRLHSYRFRLAQFAGPQATFGWWSQPDDKNTDALLTAYAYYADWYASDALQLGLPPGHFDRLIEVYRSNGAQRSMWHRALMLSWMQEMGLPVRSIAESLASELANAKDTGLAHPKTYSSMNSMVLSDDENALQLAMARVLTAQVVSKAQGKLPEGLQAQLEKAVEQIRAAHLPVGQALLLTAGKIPVTESTAILDDVRAEAPTMDRALSMIWTYQALNAGNGQTNTTKLLATGLNKLAPEKSWVAAQTVTGQTMFRWNDGKSAPKKLVLAAAPTVPTSAILQFESSESEKSSLPVRIERKIYRLVREDTSATADKSSAPPQKTAPTESADYRMELLAPDAVLKTDELYLDSVSLSALPAAGNRPIRHGIVEVPLPPGANADRTTWGIRLLQTGVKESAAMEKATFELAPHGYSVPVEVLNGTQEIRHLLRVNQTGRYVLPPVRYYRMYEPQQKAFEEKVRAAIEIR